MLCDNRRKFLMNYVLGNDTLKKIRLKTAIITIKRLLGRLLYCRQQTESGYLKVQCVREGDALMGCSRFCWSHCSPTLTDRQRGFTICGHRHPVTFGNKKNTLGGGASVKQRSYLSATVAGDRCGGGPSLAARASGSPGYLDWTASLEKTWNNFYIEYVRHI